MKKTLFATFVVFASLSVHSQTPLSRAMHSTNEQPAVFFGEVQNNLYFLNSSWDGASYGRILYSFDAAGQLISQLPLQVTVGVTDGFVSRDQHLIFLAKDQMCDVSIDTVNYYLVKSTLGGQAVFTAKLTSSIICAVQDADSTFLVFTADSMLHTFSRNLVLISSASHSLGTVYTAAALNSGDVVANHKSSNTNHLTILNSAGSVLSSKSTTAAPMSDLYVYGNNSLAGYNNTHLYIFSSSLAEKSKTAYSGAVGMAVKNDRIWMLGKHHHAAFDTSLTLLGTYNANSNDIDNRFIAVFGSRIAVLSEGKTRAQATGNETQYYSALTVQKPDTNIHFAADAQLLDIAVVDTYTTVYGPPGQSSMVHTRFTAHVRNNGAKPLTSITLNAFMYPGVACGAHFYQETVSGLNLAAGQSTVLTLNKYVESFGDGSSTMVQQFCLYTSMPDGEPDKVLADNEVCKTFSLKVGLSEQNLLSRISVYPNPSEGEVWFSSPVIVKKTEIFFADGRLIYSDATGASSGTLATADLAAGIYFVRFSDERGSVTKRLVIN